MLENARCIVPAHYHVKLRSVDQSEGRLRIPTARDARRDVEERRGDEIRQEGSEGKARLQKPANSSENQFQVESMFLFFRLKLFWETGRFRSRG